MANRVFQNVIQEMSENIDRTIGVVDHSFMVVACSEPSRIGESSYLYADLSECESVFERDHYSYRLFGVPAPEYAVFVEGTDEIAKTYSSLIAIALENIKQYYDDKYDRTNFIKNVVLDNILPGDIFVKARELHFNNSTVGRVAYLIRVQASTEISVLEVVQDLFPDKNRDFVFSINENEIVLIKEIKSGTISAEDLENLAESLVETLSSEHHVPVTVGIGTVVQNIKDLANSFKEAQVALEVSKVFDNEQTVVNYTHLGIARLIYQLPTTLCEMYLDEVFKKGSIESLDEETLFTIQKFFENNLNVSETSRKLFVHRNTLVYRLEKIKKLTGLDLREFDHAIVFKVALMVKKYLSSSPTDY